MSSRTTLAAALVGYPGVKPYPYRPTSPKVGDAWPMWRGASADGAPGHSLAHSWALLIVLPADERAASEWIDANLDGLCDAIRPAAFVTEVDPVILPVNGTPGLPALQFTCESEE